MKDENRTPGSIAARPDLFLQFAKKPREVWAIVNIAIVSVRGRDGMGNAVGGCHAAHFNGHIPGLGSVVDFGQECGSGCRSRYNLYFEDTLIQ